MPVSSRPISITTTPRPGIFCSISMKRVAAFGQDDLRAGEQPDEDAVEQAEHRLQHPDRDGERQPDQQAGDQVFLHALLFGRATIRPRRRRVDVPRLAGSCGGRLQARRRRGAGAAAGSLLGGVALGSRPCRSPASAPPSPRPCRRSAGAARRRSASAFGRLLVAAEIGDVPARALELEAGRGDLLDERRLRRTPGRRVSTGSEIFCSTSCAWPQVVQR